MWTPKIDTIGDLKHRALVSAIRADIESGRLRIGDRLPPARALAADLGLAVGTVARAYRDAAADGLIQSEVGRGTHVLGRRPRQAAAPFGARSDGLIDLSIDYPLEQMDPDPGPVLERLARTANRMELMRYLASEGSPRSRAAGVEWAARYGLTDRAIEDVVLCSGNQHALTVSLACVFGGRGGKIFAEALAYPGLKEAAGLFGVQPEPVDIDEEGMIPEALDDAYRRSGGDGIPSVVYIVPSLHNPTTVAMSTKRREALVQVASRHGLFVIEDDVHRLHAHKPDVPIAMLAPDRTFFIAGMSKVVSAGLRIAYLLPPRGQVNNAARRVLATQWSVAPLMAEIATQWIDDGTADAVRNAKAKEAEERQRIAEGILMPFSGMKSQPQSFYLWLDLPDGWTGDGFALAAARKGVGLLSDTSFRIDGGAIDRRGVRICLGAAKSRDDLRTALTSLETILRQPPGYSQRII